MASGKFTITISTDGDHSAKVSNNIDGGLVQFKNEIHRIVDIIKPKLMKALMRDISAKADAKAVKRSSKCKTNK